MKIYVDEMPKSCEDCILCQHGNIKLKKNGRYIEAKCCVLGNFYKYRKIDDEIDTCPLNSIQSQLAEKDKEIEYQENMKILAVDNQNKKAIEQLEKVKEEMVLNGSDYCEIRQGTSPHNPTDYAWFNYVMFRKLIDNQIKSLKGVKNE